MFNIFNGILKLFYMGVITIVNTINGVIDTAITVHQATLGILTPISL